MYRSLIIALVALAGVPSLVSAAPATARYSDRGIIVVGGHQAMAIKKGLRPASSRVRLGSKVALNPQPLPPRTASRTQLGAKSALNPQPLPPKAKVLLGKSSGARR